MTTFIRAFLGLFTSSFLRFWVILEINILRFLGALMAYKVKPSSVIVYFFVQSFGSIILLWGFLRTSWASVNLFYVLGIAAALVKIGVAPFHYWVIRFGKFLRWIIIFWFLVVQKILPFYLITLFLREREVWLVIFRGLFGVGGAFFNKQIKVVILYYSIFSRGWLLLRGNWETGFIYLIIFGGALFPLCNLLGVFDSSICGGLSSLQVTIIVSRKEFLVCFLRILGVPPLIGFFGKLIVLYSAAGSARWFIIGFILFLSLFIINLILSTWGVTWFTHRTNKIPQRVKSSFQVRIRVGLYWIWVFGWVFSLSKFAVSFDLALTWEIR